MSEVFRTRQEAPQEPETAPQATETIELPKDTLKGNEHKVGDIPTPEEKNLDIWEGLNRRKFITEYFPIKEFSEEFNLKMQTSKIDKFIREELGKRKYEKNIENYEAILKEIEEEIGSSRLELFERIKKLVGYVNVVNRLNKLKALKEKYLTLPE
jgi:hypothetical protein